MPDAQTTPASTGGQSHDSDQEDGHAPTGEALGPVDLTAWAYAIGGSLLGLLVIVALFVARGA